MQREQGKGIRRAGVIGTGRIAGRFMPEAGFADGIHVRAVYNPHLESAGRFAVRWGLEACGDLADFFRRVDLVYVASPHETHAAYIKAALDHGKHVLCEKPLALKGEQAKELFAYAERQNLVLFEGIKTAYCPGFRKMLEIARSGSIGTIRYVEACFTKLESGDSRELTDRMYGGSFTELGSYCLLPIIKLLGNGFEDVRFESIRGENGLDVFTKASFRYPGALASAICGLGVKAEGRLMVSGTKGYAVAEAPWWKTTDMEVHYENPLEVEKYSEPFLGDGLRYEIRAFADRVNEVENRARGGRNSCGSYDACGSFDACGSCRVCDSQRCRLTPEDSIALADIMGRFMETERLIQLESRA
ncbi:Gfo/Idh/MocA family oxidoreductase [Enterocloster bolteae]|uniref:Gfo/Idh/MocA family protein n=1 Tax=Enterocloster bolteae TaxID=208479 RepID=UPI002A83A360|nr:Gfo/Idh/MocA family oxidoreductase [Enterocloster bolteae]